LACLDWGFIGCLVIIIEDYKCLPIYNCAWLVGEGIPAEAIRGGVGGRVNGKLGPYPKLYIISNLYILANQGGLWIYL